MSSRTTNGRNGRRRSTPERYATPCTPKGQHGTNQDRRGRHSPVCQSQEVRQRSTGLRPTFIRTLLEEVRAQHGGPSREELRLLRELRNRRTSYRPSRDEGTLRLG